MAVTRNPRSKKTGKKVETFVGGAPGGPGDGSDYDKGYKKGNKRQISLTIAPELLQWVDQTAKQHGMARVAVINTCVAKARERGFFD